MCVIINLISFICNLYALFLAKKDVMSKKRRAKDTSLIEERDRDLFRAYGEVLKKHGKYATVIPKKQLIQEALEMRPQKFYLSPFSAKLIINRMLKTPTPPVND